jgi:hypothetical protein
MVDLFNDLQEGYIDTIGSLQRQLAECQAREKVLRDALEKWWGTSEEDFECIQRQALAMPSDSTALDEAIKQAKPVNKLPPKDTCPECGEKTHTGHFVVGSLFQPGFWTCDKFYDPETGRRIVS